MWDTRMLCVGVRENSLGWPVLARKCTCLSVCVTYFCCSFVGVSGHAHKHWGTEFATRAIAVRVLALMMMGISIGMAIYAAYNFKKRGDMLVYVRVFFCTVRVDVLVCVYTYKCIFEMKEKRKNVLKQKHDVHILYILCADKRWTAHMITGCSLCSLLW